MTASPSSSASSAAPGGAELLRSVGLFVDGPAVWGRPAGSSKPGVFAVELPAPQPNVQIDPAAIRAWLERVPEMRLDGRRPTVNELQTRLASFWLPGQTVLYVGSSARSIAARLNGMYKTLLGDRRPQSAGYWLKTLHDLDHTRIWWAEADDAELYEDAALDAFFAAAGARPFAVLATPSGWRRNHGITSPLRDEDGAASPARPRSAAVARSAELDRARSARLGIRSSALTGSEPDPAAARKAAAKAPPRRTSKANEVGPSTVPAHVRASQARAGAAGQQIEPVYVTEEGLAGLQAELDELSVHRRPEVIARIRSARELGDLSENADYEAARKEQSFLEGRIQQLEQMIKFASIIDPSQAGQRVALGSTVVVESSRHGEETFAIVGSAEADATAGKISFTSPIGRALIGKQAGETVAIRVPAGTIDYRIVEVR